MSKKFIAQVNNIIFRGKRYDKGDEVLVDNSVEMNKFRWLDNETHQKNLEVSVKESSDLTDAESKKKIADLTRKLAESENKLKDLEKAVKDPVSKTVTPKKTVKKVKTEEPKTEDSDTTSESDK